MNSHLHAMCSRYEPALSDDRSSADVARSSDEAELPRPGVSSSRGATDDTRKRRTDGRNTAHGGGGVHCKQVTAFMAKLR